MSEIPSHACSVWIAGDKIWAAFPGQGTTHSVHVPADEAGIKILLGILRARQIDGRHTVGTAAAPVQYDLETISKAMKITTVVKTTIAPLSETERKRALARQRDLDLADILHDLDLDGIEI
jgi:hypothetical protein